MSDLAIQRDAGPAVVLSQMILLITLRAGDHPESFEGQDEQE
jgi:hypothetical protein